MHIPASQHGSSQKAMHYEIVDCNSTCKMLWGMKTRVAGGQVEREGDDTIYYMKAGAWRNILADEEALNPDSCVQGQVTMVVGV
jgi:hypothetical protein